MVGEKKIPLFLRCFLFFYFSIGIILNFPYKYFNLNNNISQGSYQNNYIHASPSSIISTNKIDIYEYYIEVCNVTLWTVNQFELLIDSYPDKYKSIKSKVSSFNKDKTNTADIQELKENVEYCLGYMNELTTLVEEEGLDQYIERDYNNLIEK